MTVYFPRLVDHLVAGLMAQAPALLLTGPRASGKTTTASRLAVETVRLDRPAQAAAFVADPDAALASHPTPLLIDDWQVVPQVLGAIKRAVDADPTPGRFVLTGSVRADLDHRMRPGTGRVIRIPIWPLTQRELLRGRGPGLLDRIIASGSEAMTTPQKPPGLPDYLAMATAGGLPPAVLHDDPAYRRRWYTSYLEQLVTRDAAEIDHARDPVRLRRYLQVLAENTAGLPANATIVEASGINPRTAATYDRLLGALSVLEVVPAWSHHRLKRLTQRGKRYLTDTGLTAAILRVNAAGLLRDGDLFDRMLDSYVTTQIRAEISVSPSLPTLHHFRDRDGHEIDLIVDYGHEGVIAIEITANVAPSMRDARHLIWLQERLPGLRAGLILHTGPQVYQLHPGIFALPIACLWS